jgi:hypothetical protein
MSVEGKSGISRRLFAAFAALSLAGCAGPSSVGSPVAAGWRSIAVIAVVDDEIHLNYVGATVFNNTNETVPVDWKIGEAVQARLEDVLRTRFEVRSLSFDPAVFRGAHPSKMMGTGDLTARLKSAVKPGLVDAIVIAAGFGAGVSVGRPTSFSDNRFVGAAYTLTVFDGNTLEPVAHENGQLACAKSLCFPVDYIVKRDVDLGWRGEPASTLSAETREKIRSIMFELIDESVPNTVRQMKLLSPSAG